MADTVGYADPEQVRTVFNAVIAEARNLLVGANFHDTRGLGLANVTAALDCGVRSFDATLGGPGGCPLAPGATGNIVTEDLVLMLDSMGLRAGIDLGKPLAVRDIPIRNLPPTCFAGQLPVRAHPLNYVPAAIRHSSSS